MRIALLAIAPLLLAGCLGQIVPNGLDDDTAPVLTNFMPAPGAVSVPTNSHYQVLFDDRMTLAGVSSNTFWVERTNDGRRLRVREYLLVQGGNGIRLKLDEELVPFQVYRVVLRPGPCNASTIPLADGAEWLFTSGNTRTNYVPGLSITSPGAGHATNTHVTLSGTTYDTLKLSVAVNVTNSADDWQSITTSPNWSSTLSVTDPLYSGYFHEGTNRIYVKAHGYAEDLVKHVEVIIDRTNPVVSITTPGAGIAGYATVAGTAADDRQLARVEWRTNSGPWTPTTAGPWALGFETRQTLSGTHLTLDVRAVDKAGNAATNTRVFTVTNWSDTYKGLAGFIWGAALAAHDDGRLETAYRPSPWSFTTLPTSSFGGDQPDLVIRATRAALLSINGANLSCGYYNGSGWSETTVTNNAVGIRHAAGLDPAGNPWALFTTGSYRNHVALRTNGTWRVQQVTQDATAHGTRGALDSAGRMHVVYPFIGGPMYTVLFFYKRYRWLASQDKFTNENYVQLADEASVPPPSYELTNMEAVVAVDSADRAHVLYLLNGRTTLRYTRDTGSGKPQTTAVTVFTAAEPMRNLVADWGNGAVHLSYLQGGNLWYARIAPDGAHTNWLVSSIPSSAYMPRLRYRFYGGRHLVDATCPSRFYNGVHFYELTAY